MLEVIESGLHGTIQDSGREGYGHLGVRRSGAADRSALAAANLLAGNATHAPALEMTLLGGTFAVLEDTLVALAGADMEAHVPEDSRRLPPGASYRLRAGTTVVFGGALDGARAYLALPGGIEAQVDLGSAAADPLGGLGGFGGRPLAVGDQLRGRSTRVGPERRWPAGSPSSGVQVGDGPVLVSVATVPGPHLEMLPRGTLEALTEGAWLVTQHADRAGIRLEGDPVAGADGLDLASLPMLPGAIQLPGSGQPIVLMPDAPTVGGYPVPAVVAEVDQPQLGQLRPADQLRFEWVDIQEARRCAITQVEAVEAAAAAIE